MRDYKSIDEAMLAHQFDQGLAACRSLVQRMDEEQLCSLLKEFSLRMEHGSDTEALGYGFACLGLLTAMQSAIESESTGD